MQKKVIKIGVRGSELALAMAEEVEQTLRRVKGFSSHVEIIPMSTLGDKILNQPLGSIGGKGLFTEAIEKALLNNEIDIAVHSTKDMPSILPEGLHLASYINRGAIADCFISHKNVPFIVLPSGSVIGTASLRREALVKKYRPDLQVKMLRGNVPTRIERVKAGEFDGTFLALCGLQRLNLTSYITENLDVSFFPPAPAQGCICLETRIFDDEINNLVRQVNDINTQIEVVAEREFLKALDGNCRTPISAYARLSNDRLFFYGQKLSVDGKQSYEFKDTIVLNQDQLVTNAMDLGKRAADAVKLLECQGS